MCIILILEMYSRYFDPVTENQLSRESINIIYHKVCDWFRLSIGFSKAYCHYNRELGYPPNWVEEGKTSWQERFEMLFLGYFTAKIILKMSGCYFL